MFIFVPFRLFGKKAAWAHQAHYTYQPNLILHDRLVLKTTRNMHHDVRYMTQNPYNNSSVVVNNSLAHCATFAPSILTCWYVKGNSNSCLCSLFYLRVSRESFIAQVFFVLLSTQFPPYRKPYILSLSEFRVYSSPGLFRTNETLCWFVNVSSSALQKPHFQIFN